MLYEAPHRVRETVAELAATLGARTLVVARELTKMFETIARMPLAEAAAWLDADANRKRGEFVLIVDAPASQRPRQSGDADRWLAELVREIPPARAARIAASVTGIARDRLYARALALKRDAER